MFDPFMMDGLDPYGMDEELDEQQEMLAVLAACMPMYKCDSFEDTLESACYVCNIDRESLSEEDLDFLEEMYETE